jgi:excisionase family DNA binding protein
LLPALVFGKTRSKRRKLSTGLGSWRPTRSEQAYGASDGTALLTVKDTAKLLGVCLATVYTMVERSEIEHVRVSNTIRIVVHDPWVRC